jgi:transposase
VRFKLLPGQRSELIGLDAVIEGLNFGALLADRAFDTNALRAELQSRNAKAMIPSKKLRKPLISHDGDLYKRRHLIENYFSKIKEFRGVNTRYDKTDSSYAASWHIAATIIALR